MVPLVWINTFSNTISESDTVVTTELEPVNVELTVLACSRYTVYDEREIIFKVVIIITVIVDFR